MILINQFIKKQKRFIASIRNQESSAGRRTAPHRTAPHLFTARRDEPKKNIDYLG